MAAAAEAAAGDDAESQPAKKGGKKKLIVLVALELLLAGAGAGLWFGGILPPLLGMGKKADPHAAEDAGHAAGDGKGDAKADGKAVPKPDAKPLPVFMDLPEIIANLNAGPRRNSFIKLRPKLELARAEDEAAIKAAMPRLMDLFQTYLREMRPEELRGSAGTYRLREELLARANIAVAPARIVDVLFPEIIVQ
jgi:flagellar FliL protein